MKTVEEKRQWEKEVVSLMISLYCRKKHKTKNGLCPQCKELLDYAMVRSDKCPFMETKTFCSNCKVHCYKAEMRKRIKEVMAFSGPRMIFHHPVIAVSHVIESKKDWRHKMKIRKALYIVLGCIGVGLGAVGAVLPLLPAFPFLLLAAVCFAKSSERLHSWFTSTKLYKNNLESFVRGKGMTWKTKIRIMIIVTATMSVGFIMMSRVPVGRIILACVWVFHIFYFIFGIKTLKEDGNDSLCMRILKVEGMKCENCALRLECAFNKNEGMVAKADYPTKTVKVFLKNPEETKRLESIAADLGYKAKLLKETA